MDSGKEIANILSELKELDLNSEFYKIAQKTIISITTLLFYIDKNHAPLEKQYEYIEIAHILLLLFENVYLENSGFVKLIYKLQKEINLRRDRIRIQ